MTATLEIPATLTNSFTSTGAKLFHHQEAMRTLVNGYGRAITCHLMPTDRCNHTCAFCSVQTRAGNILPMSAMIGFIEILVRYGLKAVVISGGGNPILYRCPETKMGFNDLIARIKWYGLKIGVITNGAPMKKYPCGRTSWTTVSPETLDSLDWCRISMSGLDHKEEEVFVPDFDRTKTTLGFSYIYHDLYFAPGEKNHGKVSTPQDLLQYGGSGGRAPIMGRDRLPRLTEQFREYVDKHLPRYLRLVANCLQPHLVNERCDELQQIADAIDPSRVFVQRKLPNPHTSCTVGVFHPILNSDGFLYPCDAVTLNTEVREPGQHDFGPQWRICHWSDAASLYEKPIRTLIDDPVSQCPNCLFGTQNRILAGVADGSISPVPSATPPDHVDFI